MRVLQVIPELKLAGAQIMVENLSLELIKQGCTVKVVSLYSEVTPVSERLKANGVEVNYLNKKSGLDIGVIGRLRRIILKYKPDVIHTHSYALKYAIVAKTGLHCQPLVHTIHNLADKETTKSNLILEKILFQKRDAVPVAISPLIKRSIMEYYNLASDYVPMIFNGIDVEKYEPKTEYSFMNDEIRIIHIGRFQEQKNHEMIIEAMSMLAAQYPKVKLYLFGEGPLKNEIQELVIREKLNGNVIFAGMTRSPDIELKRSDLFILPSKWEGMPITLIEAMACALPIVATPVGGVPDMVQDQNSALLVKNCAQSLADGIERLIKDESLRKKLGKNARKNVISFSSREMGKEYLNLYEKTYLTAKRED